MSNYNFPLFDNRDKSRYEIHVEEYVPQIDYMKSNNNEIFLTHTEVPDQISGQGIGSYLVRKCLEDIDEKGLRLIPLCPFVAAYIKKNPEWIRLVRQ